tara:strand:- start:113 stop:640 length:528 start_codon:yes stop_codon:yes gene_type:complete
MSLIKKAFLIFVLSTISSNLLANNSKIVFIDMDKLLNNSIVGKSVNKKIGSIIEKNKLEKENLEKDIKADDEKISSQKNVLNDEEIKKMVNDLNKKIKNYQEIISEHKKNVQKIRVDSSAIILENLKPILSEYSDKNSISIVLQKKDVIIGKNELNITKDIIKILDNKLKKIDIE